MPATQREVPGRPTREGKEAPPLPAPLPAGNAEAAVFARAEQYVRGVLLEDSAMQGCVRRCLPLSVWANKYQYRVAHLLTD